MSKNRSAARRHDVAAVETNLETNAKIEVAAAEPGPAIETGAEVPSDAAINAAIDAEVAEHVEPPLETLISDPAWMIARSADFLIGYFGNKSKAIRGLTVMGHKPGPISRALGIRYQHVRNVLEKPLKRVIKAERDAATTSATAEPS